MKLNVGNIESFIRIFVGVSLLFCALYGIIGQWGYLGVIMIATGMGRFCPLYTVLGINTCKFDSSSSGH